MDIRATAARFYDLEPNFPDDIPFYFGLIPSGDSVLELGCGTGRVTLPLARRGNDVHGIELSPAMAARCRKRLADSGYLAVSTHIEIGDITSFSLGRQFDWIIAPYRVLQNLVTDQQVDGLFTSIRTHLAPGGSCVLNVFHTNRDPESLRLHWVDPKEYLDWEQEIDGEWVTCHYRTARIDPENLVLYPEIIYRRYQAGEMLEEEVLKIAMRCYYPDEFQALVTAHGFHITGSWGGYHGEVYGHGPELVLQFQAQ